MKTARKKRNWSQYNQKLKNIARMDFFISEEAIKDWHYSGKHKKGGKLLYSKHVIELCLLMREFYHLPYRQTEGFVDSVIKALHPDLSIPDYTTISRRAAKIEISLRNKRLIKANKEGIVVAIDSTGFSLYTLKEWNRIKNDKRRLEKTERWRKLHVAIDVSTGEILASKYTKSTANDGPELPGLLNSIEEKVSAVCGDMAYDTVNCREAIQLKKAQQLIPPIRAASLASTDRRKKKYRHILQERDEAINYIKYNTINGNKSLARKSWKEKVGYHARSLVETTMWQIKSHCSDYLRNKREDTRETQARIKCKIVNLVIAA
jgi:hypothetical protein